MQKIINTHFQRKSRTRGFTIVELLIVIVVIGVLAAITIVAFNNVQTRARNNARASEAAEWQKILITYGIDNGKFPDDATTYCLGEGFPRYGGATGRCWDASGGTIVYENATINTALKTVAPKLPNNGRSLIVGSDARERVGPAAIWEGGVLKIVYWIEGGTTPCPLGTVRWADAGNVTRSCNITLANPS